VSGWWAVSYAALWAVVVALSLLVVALARQVGVLHMRLGPRGALEVDQEGPPLGSAPEPHEVRDLEGRTLVVAGPGRPQLLLFVSPGCPVCREVVPSVGAVARDGGLLPIVVADAQPEEAAASYGRLRPPARTVAAEGLPERYGVPGTPYVVVLDEFGVVRSKGTVNNLEQMEGLVETAWARLEELRRLDGSPGDRDHAPGASDEQEEVAAR
jgi:methylamine dehydrogenase accessory protein MauD